MIIMALQTHTPLPLTEWLGQALDYSGLSQAALAELMDAKSSQKVDRSIVNKMRNGRRKIRAEELIIISEITWFPTPESTSPPSTVTIAGKVGAGAKVPVFDAYEPGDGPQVERPSMLPLNGIVAVEVEGDSMEPIYSAGDLLFYSRTSHDGAPLDEVVGYRCVVEDENGMGWVKQVKLGTQKGLFNLIALNPEASNMHDVRLKWAARVLLHMPAEYVRKG